MPAFLLFLALLLLACDPTPPITPESPPDGGQGGASSASSSSSSVASSGSQGAGTGGNGGVGGSGGGLSCDPCQDTDGARIAHRRQVTTTLDGYQRVTEIGMFDTLRAEACAPNIATDGVLRCLPMQLAFVSHFADAACSTVLFYVPVGGCAKPSMYGGEVVEVLGVCGGGTRIRKLAGEHIGDVYGKSGASCVKLGSQVPNLYLGGAEVTPGAFAIVEQSESTP